MDDEVVDPSLRYCELMDDMIEGDNEFFKMENHYLSAISFLGLAASTGVRVNEIRELIDMVDTLSQCIKDPDVKLSDDIRKKINHAEEAWLDIKEKMSNGDARTAYLLLAYKELSDAHASLCKMKKDPKFSEYISDYILNYTLKGAFYIQSKAIGDVRL
ncbi:DUF1940 domain-containing protein [Caldiplasma sukawensis]